MRSGLRSKFSPCDSSIYRGAQLCVPVVPELRGLLRRHGPFGDFRSVQTMKVRQRRSVDLIGLQAECAPISGRSAKTSQPSRILIILIYRQVFFCKKGKLTPSPDRIVYREFLSYPPSTHSSQIPEVLIFLSFWLPHLKV